MIIPTMTLEEIRKELEKDYPIVLRKMYYIIQDLNKKQSKATLKQGYVHSFDYLSKYKNHWLCQVRSGKKKNNYRSMMLYHNGKGHAAISMTDEKHIIYHTGHFFERHNERLRLGLNNLNDIIRAYMVEDDIVRFQEMEEIEPGIWKVFGMIESGIILGMFNKPLDLLKINTFVANDMLTKNQKELTEELIESLEKYKHTSGDLN
jgi:hypothetical protein